MIPKQKRWRCPKYLAWVRTRPCCLCGGQANAAHHLIGMWGMSGMGLKAPDSMAIPVCDGPGDTCHRKIHASKELQQLQPEWIEQTLRDAVIEFEGVYLVYDELINSLEFVRGKMDE